MIVTYAPEPEPGETRQEPRVWEFDPTRVRQSKAEIIQKLSGMVWEEFCQRARGGDAKAQRVLLWHLLSLEHHTLKLEDVPDYCMGELKVQRSRGELRAMAAEIEAGGLDDDDKRQFVIGLQIEMGNAPEAPSEVGKSDEESATSSSSENGTGSTSPNFFTSDLGS